MAITALGADCSRTARNALTVRLTCRIIFANGEVAMKHGLPVLRQAGMPAVIRVVIRAVMRAVPRAGMWLACTVPGKDAARQANPNPQ